MPTTDGAPAGLINTDQILHLGTPQCAVLVACPVTACVAQYGPRFDRLGAVYQVLLNGIPMLAREGLIDEFNISADLPPPGYKDAAPGSPFVKVGVGELNRPDDEPYRFSGAYAVRQAAPIALRREINQLSITQSCASVTGYSYRYTKNYRLDPVTQTLVIEFVMTNTGQQVLALEHYNHNWFSLGGRQPDATYRLTTRFPLAHAPLGGWLTQAPHSLAPRAVMNTPAYAPYPTVSAPAADNWFRLELTDSPLAVEVSGNFPVSRFAQYADPTSFCPEVFGVHHLVPCQSASWTRTYVFHCD